MSFKAILFCAQALLIQAISSQCIGAYNGLAEGYGWGASPYAMEQITRGAEWASPCNAEWSGPWNSAGRMRAAEYDAAMESRLGYGISGGLMPATVAASNGGGFAVTSSSPISPNGVSLISENAIEGPLLVSGEIPFLGAVALEGTLPTAGSGGVAYGSGNGNVAILNEDLNAYGAYGYAQGIPAPALAASAMAPGLPSPYAAGLAGPASYGYNRGCGCGRI
ncbi:chorion class B protein PC10-like [Pieris rapae]|uniref:chorion class B protein PC10-like n=1 Tax=Pieris rapae TaxID=64459 RepID=UPI001E27B407|nr:chorion class B protein PC10-like [Pieris rapae]